MKASQPNCRSCAIPGSQKKNSRARQTYQVHLTFSKCRCREIDWRSILLRIFFQIWKSLGHLVTWTHPTKPCWKSIGLASSWPWKITTSNHKKWLRFFPAFQANHFHIFTMITPKPSLEVFIEHQAKPISRITQLLCSTFAKMHRALG